MTTVPHQITVSAPGKLIISGEHAVVHGCPALAIATPHQLGLKLTPAAPGTVNVNVEDMQLSWCWSDIEAIYQQAQNQLLQWQQHFDNFITLDSPTILAASIFNYVKTLQIDYANTGFTLSVPKLNAPALPIGCGLGSSAAVAAALVKALANWFNTPLTQAQLFDLGQYSETLQHGKASGIDLSVVITGGALAFKNGAIDKRQWQLPPCFLLNTGKPRASTGECVAQSRTQFNKNPKLVSTFADTVNAIDNALAKQDTHTFNDQIKINHRLLCQLGVVPEATQKLIKTIEAAGGAAKICGAGATRGDHAGIVLIYADTPEKLSKLQLPLEPLHVNQQGVHCV